MAITTYAELQTAIPEWMERTGDTAIVNRVPDFVKMCEARLNRTLRVRQMEAQADLSPSSGVYTLPSDYLEWRRVTAKTTPRRELKYVSAQYADDQFPYREAGYPLVFTIEGSTLRVLPTTSSDVDLQYYQAIPPLADNSTNWLLTAAPDVYLFGSLVEAGIFSSDPELTPGYEGRFALAVRELEKADMGGRFALGGARVRGVTP